MTAINPLGGGGIYPSSPLPSTTSAKPGAGGFMNMIDGLMSKLNAEQNTANQAVTELAMGNTDNMHGVMLAVAKSDLSFRMFLEIRNRLAEALQEIMRMQV